jgi:CRP-like cAMP-binding protein
LIRQGELGDAYYAIATGELDIQKNGRFARRCRRGDGVGEIALLRDVPRTATITAHTPATVYRLSRELFLTAVLGHVPTHQQAARIADAPGRRRRHIHRHANGRPGGAGLDGTIRRTGFISRSAR